MAVSGFVLLHRSLLGHPVFRDDSEALAFIWMVAKAAWKPVTVRYKGKTIDLDRGQLCVSQRDMAAALGRDKAWVERFWKRLKSEAMIEAVNEAVREAPREAAGEAPREAVREAGTKIISICNYDRFQDFSKGREAPHEAACEAVDEAGREALGEAPSEAESEAQNNKSKQIPTTTTRDPFGEIGVATATCLRASGIAITPAQPAKFAAQLDIVRQWVADGISIDDVVVPMLEKEVVANPNDRRHSLAYFAPMVARRLAERNAKAKGATAAGDTGGLAALIRASKKYEA